MVVAGKLGAQLLQAVILGLCLRAFGYHATMAELILVNSIADLLAGFMPVPGGMGVAEAAYTAGLVALGVPERRRDLHRDRLPDGYLLPATGLGRGRHALAATARLPVIGALAGSFTGRCCIWTVHGISKPRPPVRDRIAKVRWSNATGSRRSTGASTASSQ